MVMRLEIEMMKAMIKTMTKTITIIIMKTMVIGANLSMQSEYK